MNKLFCDVCEEELIDVGICWLEWLHEKIDGKWRYKNNSLRMVHFGCKYNPNDKNLDIGLSDGYISWYTEENGLHNLLLNIENKEFSQKDGFKIIKRLHCGKELKYRENF